MKHVAILALLVLALGGSAEAGPPCICWELDITGHASLPWDGGAPAKRYDVSDVVEDTLALLDADAPVLVRMETLRRAAICIDRRADRMNALLARLQERTLDAEAAGTPDALAWFDAGYAVACFRQHDMLERSGYAWVARALRLAKGDGQMNYGAALMTLMGNHPDHERFGEHLRAARARAGDGPLLARNMELLEKRYPAVLRYFEQRKKSEAAKQASAEEDRDADRR